MIQMQSLNQPIKCAPYGRRTLVPRAAYWGRYKPMKNIAAILGIIFLAGCVSPQQQALNDACDSSKERRKFPAEKSIEKIHVQFQIGQGSDQININETAACEYQGSFCPAGDWYDVWYGNKEMKRDIALSKDRTLTIWHHALCINLYDYQRQCADGKCTATEYFKFRLQLNPQETETRKDQCSKLNDKGVTTDRKEFIRCGIPSVDLVNLEELKNYGYEITGESIEVINDGL